MNFTKTERHKKNPENLENHENTLSQSYQDVPQLIESALVVSVSDEALWVQTQRKTACGGCQHSSGCGTSSLSKLFMGHRSEPIRLAKPSNLDFAPGDWVEIRLEESALVKQAFWAYGLPLIGLFLGAFVGQWVWPVMASAQELGVISMAIIGLVAGWGVTKKLCHPVIPEVIRKIELNDGL